MQLFVCTEVPVTKKKILKVLDSGTIDTQMGVSPERFIFLVIYIPIVHIYSTYKCGTPVYYNYFSMVSVVEPIRQCYEINP